MIIQNLGIILKMDLISILHEKLDKMQRFENRC